LVKQYPEYENWIRIYYDRWEDMLGGIIPETVALLDNLKRINTHQLYALTNWSAEAFPVALKRYDFFKHFEGIVVSGDEKTRKPFPKIYEILLKRYDLNPTNCLFIDDNYENIVAAEKMGINGIHYKNTERLLKDLSDYDIHIT